MSVSIFFEVDPLANMRSCVIRRDSATGSLAKGKAGLNCGVSSICVGSTGGAE